MDKLTEQIKRYTPKFASSCLGRDGTIKFWGYKFLEPTKSCRGETYTRSCFSALQKAEDKLIQICSPSKIIVNERDEGEMIDEQELDNKWRIAKMASKIFKKSARLLYHEEESIFTNDEPTQQRLLVLERPEGKISFGVSYKRVCRISSVNVNFQWTGNGAAGYFRYSEIPVLIGLHGFERGQRFYHGLNEKLRDTEFPGLRREIPFG